MASTRLFGESEEKSPRERALLFVIVALTSAIASSLLSLLFPNLRLTERLERILVQVRHGDARGEL